MSDVIPAGQTFRLGSSEPTTLADEIEIEDGRRRMMEQLERDTRPISDLPMLRSLRPGHGVLGVRSLPEGRAVLYTDGATAAIRWDGLCRLLRDDEILS